jgi:hypothetical protein
LAAEQQLAFVTLLSRAAVCAFVLVLVTTPASASGAVLLLSIQLSWTGRSAETPAVPRPVLMLTAAMSRSRSVLMTNRRRLSYRPWDRRTVAD